MKSVGVCLALAALIGNSVFCQQRKTERERHGFLGEVYAVRVTTIFPTRQGEAQPVPERHTTSYYDKNGDLIFQLDYVDGRMVRRRTFRHNSPDESIEKIEDGGVQSADDDVTGPNPRPAQVIKHSAKFDGDGNLIEESLYSENGSLLERTEYKCDQRGRMLEKSVKSQQGGNLPGRTTFAYGDGNEPASSTYELRGQSTTVTYSYEFDSRGNWTKKRPQGPGPVVERIITYYSPEPGPSGQTGLSDRAGKGIPIPGESPADPLQPTPLSALPKVIRKSGGVLQASAVRRVEPMYPIEARAAHIIGRVDVEVHIDHDGAVVETRALSGPRELQSAAVEAAKRWKFRPTTLSGVLVDVIGVITFNFQM